MLKKSLSALLIATLVALTNLAPVKAQTYKTADLQKIAKVKANVAKLAASPNTKVIIKLEGGEQIKGTLNSLGENSFVVELFDGRGTREIPYFQVKEVNRKPSTGKIIAIVGLAAGASVGILYGTAYLLSKCGPCIE